jgi:hypothetical protein
MTPVIESVQDRVASLWIGKRLSILEKLCLKSFADVGQTLILYTYGPLEQTPDYIEWRDAETILPLDKAGRIYRDPVNHSPAVHADIFRLNLLRQTDEIWVDCDAYAVKPFQTKDGYLLSGRRDGRRRLRNGVISRPKDSPALLRWLDFVHETPCIPPWWDAQLKNQYVKLYGKRASFATLPLGVIGPLAAYYFLEQSGEIDLVFPESEYYALPFSSRLEWFAQDKGQLDTYDWQSKRSIHLFSSAFRTNFARRNNQIRRDSLIGKLIIKHGLDQDPDAVLI